MIETLQLDLHPRTLATLLPHVERARDEEWEDDRTRVELENLANDLRARLQHAVRDQMMLARSHVDSD